MAGWRRRLSMALVGGAVFVTLPLAGAAPAVASPHIPSVQGVVLADIYPSPALFALYAKGAGGGTHATGSFAWLASGFALSGSVNCLVTGGTEADGYYAVASGNTTYASSGEWPYFQVIMVTPDRVFAQFKAGGDPYDCSEVAVPPDTSGFPTTIAGFVHITTG